VAIELAKHFSTSVLSADSRQIYKEMNIGTAKPTPDELSQVKHYLVDHVSMFDYYSAGNYEREALGVLDSLFEKNKVAIVAGGTGLYIDALCKGLDDMPKISEDTRKYVKEHLLSDEASLKAFIEKEDPVYWKQVDVHNLRRLERAASVIVETKKPYSSFLGKKTAQRPFEIVYITLDWPRESLYERINKRVDLMIENGLVEEVKSLYLHKGISALQTVGYQELFGYFKGEFSLEESIALIKQNSRRYAKRQLTWFRRNKEATWLMPNQIDEMIKIISERL